MRTILALCFAAGLTAAVPASAATRSYTLTSFDRIRVEGPYAVNLVTNRAPFARATGSTRAIEGVSLRVEGEPCTSAPTAPPGAAIPISPPVRWSSTSAPTTLHRPR